MEDPILPPDLPPTNKYHFPPFHLNLSSLTSQSTPVINDNQWQTAMQPRPRRIHPLLKPFPVRDTPKRLPSPSATRSPGDKQQSTPSPQSSRRFPNPLLTPRSPASLSSRILTFQPRYRLSSGNRSPVPATILSAAGSTILSRPPTPLSNSLSSATFLSLPARI